MVKHGHKRRHTHRRSHRRHRRSNMRSNRVKKGGTGNYSSASSYNSYVNGSGDSQYSRVFDQAGSYDGRQSNLLIGEQGQWGTQPNTPTAQNLSLIQTAGRRHKMHGRKTRKHRR